MVRGQIMAWIFHCERCLLLLCMSLFPHFCFWFSPHQFLCFSPSKRGTLALHSSSRVHTDAMVAWQQYKINQKDHTSIAHRLDQIGERVIQENQHYLKTICEVILLCAQQKIALRSHNKSDSLENPGNFWQLWVDQVSMTRLGIYRNMHLRMLCINDHYKLCPC